MLARVVVRVLATALARMLICAGLVIAVGTGSAVGVELPAEQHPSLLFTVDKIPELKERILREPYASWWQTVSTRAESAPTTFSDERSKARFAKSLAFAYLMTDDATLADRAVDLLLDMKFPPRDGDLGEPHNEGEVVAIYAVAYDMLHTFLQDTPESLTEIRTILAEEAARLRKGIVVVEQDLGFFGTLKIRLHETPDPRDASVTHLDNWHIRAYGGLGLAALALADHAGLDGKTPQDWLDRAHDLVTRSISHQVDATDGGYAEGPFYSRYAADVYLPYMFALKELTGTDLFVDPQVQDMHDWSVNIRLPNGLRPNIDDGHLSNFYGHYLASVDADGGVHRWDWENNSSGLFVREFSEMDAIALYDDSVTAEEPTRGPSVFMPEAGDAVFRSDWTSEATYMLLRGEHDRARLQGLGHEHADETSFILYAGGEMLALDAGYINFSNHNKVNSGRNHNVILVDGVGPPLVKVAGEAVDGGNDAFIEEEFTSDFMDYAEVRAEYGDVDFRRRVMFADNAYFVVGDEVRADASHLYEWRLHGNGGGTSGGTYERAENLTRWSRSGAELLAFLPSREGRTFAETDTLHSFDYLEETTHTALQVQESVANTEFLSVLFPRALDPVGEEPTLSAPAASGGQAVQISLAAGDDFAWIAAVDGDTVRVETATGQIATDGRFGFVRISDGTVTAFNVQDGSFLSVAEAEVFSADAEIDVSLAFGDDGMTGFLRGGEDGYQVVVHSADSVGVVTYQDAISSSLYVDQAVTLQLSGAGQLAAETIPINAPPTASGQSVGADEDTSITLTLTGADADGDALNFAIVSQPSGGTVTLLGATVTYAPTADFSGSDSFTFTAGDGVSTSSAATVSILVAPVNDLPTLSAFADQTVEANSEAVSLSFTIGPGGGSDEAAQTIAVTATSSDPSVVPHPSVSDGTVSFAPVADASGSVTITVTADDGQAVNGVTEEIFAITVTPVAVIPSNDPPTARGRTVFTNEDTSVSLTLTGTDTDGDSLTFAIVSQPSGGTVNLRGATVIYAPTADFSGSDSFTFTAGDGVSTSSAATVSILVAPVNDLPTLSAFADQTVEANSEALSLSFTIGPGGGSDEAAQTVAVTATSSDPTVVPHPTVADGTVTFAPVADTSGSVTITVTANDGQGVNGVTEETFAVTVSPVDAVEVTLPTDYDGSGKVDLFDFFIFSDAFGKPVDEDSARFDLDGSGAVNLFDFFIFADTFGATAG